MTIIIFNNIVTTIVGAVNGGKKKYTCPQTPHVQVTDLSDSYTYTYYTCTNISFCAVYRYDPGDKLRVPKTIR